MIETLLDQIWRDHTVRRLPSGQTRLLIALHLIHEGTSPQAFQTIGEAGLRVRFPEGTFATIGHIVPQARYRGAAVLMIGLNFGCGSSREHAPECFWP